MHKTFPGGFSILVYKTLVAGTRQEHGVWQLKKKDGSTLLASITMKPLWNEEKILGFVEIIEYCTSFM